MSIIMACGMELYNVAHKMGGMSNSVFLPALKEAAFMWLFVFLFSNLFGNTLGKKLAFRHVTPGGNNPFFIILMISCCTVAIMCPTMSLVATIIFTGFDKEIIANWLATIAKNFPMALFLQLFFAGPIVRLLFRTFFKSQLAAQHKVVPVCIGDCEVPTFRD